VAYMRGIAFLAILGLLLSGCSGNDGKQDADEDLFDDAPQAALGKGLIRGLVLTPALVPVPGATIQMTSSGLNENSDENGAFVFADLEPGSYFLEVSKPGWTTVQQQAEVVADEQEPPIVKVAIDRLPGSFPRAVTLQQDGFISCSVGTPRTYSSCAIDAIGQEENPEIYYTIDGVPSAIQTEIIWDSTQPTGDWLYVVQGFCTCDGGVPDLVEEGGARFNETESATSPYVARASNAYLKEWNVGSDPSVAQLVVSVSSSGPEPETTNGSGVALNQAFSVYATFFYNIPEPDPAWTFGANGPYPVPTEG
jgi:hypothetical protein